MREASGTGKRLLDVADLESDVVQADKASLGGHPVSLRSLVSDIDRDAAPNAIPSDARSVTRTRRRAEGRRGDRRRLGKAPTPHPTRVAKTPACIASQTRR